MTLSQRAGASTTHLEGTQLDAGPGDEGGTELRDCMSTKARWWHCPCWVVESDSSGGLGVPQVCLAEMTAVGVMLAY